MVSALALALVLPAFAAKPVQGVALHLCSCQAPCPCMFSIAGDMEGCNLTAVYHITDGGYVSKNLSGLTVIVVGKPGELSQKDREDKVVKPTDLALYLPTGISEKQARDLKFIIAEHQSRFVGGTWRTRSVPIQFRALGDAYLVEIPGILSAKTTAIVGDENKPMTVNNVPFEEGRLWTLGRTTTNHYTDPVEKDWKWDYPDKNGAWCKFSWRPIHHG